MSVNAARKLRVFRRDGFKCKNCGRSEDLTIDHIQPRSKGGNDDEKNLQTLCAQCNYKKGSFLIKKETSYPAKWKILWGMLVNYVEKKRYRMLQKPPTVTQPINSKEKLATIVEALKPSIIEWLNSAHMKLNVNITGIQNTVKAYEANQEDKNKVVFHQIEKITLHQNETTDRINAFTDFLGIVYNETEKKYYQKTPTPKI